MSCFFITISLFWCQNRTLKLRRDAHCNIKIRHTTNYEKKYILISGKLPYTRSRHVKGLPVSKFTSLQLKIYDIQTKLELGTVFKNGTNDSGKVNKITEGSLLSGSLVSEKNKLNSMLSFWKLWNLFILTSQTIPLKNHIVSSCSLKKESKLKPWRKQNSSK